MFANREDRNRNRDASGGFLLILAYLLTRLMFSCGYKMVMAIRSCLGKTKLLEIQYSPTARRENMAPAKTEVTF